jgi:hypothetical protein
MPIPTVVIPDVEDLGSDRCGAGNQSLIRQLTEKL